MQKILIIKLGALGDFIQALGAMRAIRQQHSDAEITLLTTKPFIDFASQCGYVDQIWIDERPRWHQITKWLKLKNKLNNENFTRVYDLQNNDRTNFYFHLLSNPKPEWVGTAIGASHRNASPTRSQGHALDGHIETLGLAGIHNIEIDKLEWMKADISQWDLPDNFVLIVPGCAPSRPEKRWPAEQYAVLCKNLLSRNIQPIIIGTKDDQSAAEIITAQCPDALSLVGETTLPHIATLARHALAAIGNDTGPMHLIAATGCQSIALFSGTSKVIKHGPKGENIKIIQKAEIANIEPQEIISALKLPNAQSQTMSSIRH